jgi:membrane associated rhomboid family serine protease
MDVHDLDYNAADARAAGRRTPIGVLRATSVTTWLIVINVAVFAIESLLLWRGYGYRVFIPIAPYRVEVMTFSPIDWWGHFSAATALARGQVWRFITFQFIHAGLLHLLFNMLALFMFGQFVESYLGRVRFLAFYLVCGIGGALAYLGLWVVGLLVYEPWVPLVGASAGIFGVILAAAMIAPDEIVVLLFPPIPMRLKTLAFGLLVVAAATVLMGGRNAGGEAAHIGGAVVGVLLMRFPRSMNGFARATPVRWIEDER